MLPIQPPASLTLTDALHQGMSQLCVLLPVNVLSSLEPKPYLLYMQPSVGSTAGTAAQAGPWQEEWHQLTR